jgi:hypothetical protein
MREMKRTTGGRVGYESVNVSVRRNDPSSKGVSAGRQRSPVGRRVNHGLMNWDICLFQHHLLHLKRVRDGSQGTVVE